MIEITLHTTHYEILIVIPITCKTLGGNTIINVITFLDDTLYWKQYSYNFLRGTSID